MSERSPRDVTVMATLVGGTTGEDIQVTVTSAGVTAKSEDFNVLPAAFNINIAAERTSTTRKVFVRTVDDERETIQLAGMAQGNFPATATTITLKHNAETCGLVASASTLDIDKPGSYRT